MNDGLFAKINSNSLQKMDACNIGDVYFHTHYHLYYRVERFEHRQPYPEQNPNLWEDVVYLSETADGLTWRDSQDPENSVKVVKLQNMLRPSSSWGYIKVHLENGQTVADAIRELEQKLVESLLHPEKVLARVEEPEESSETALMPANGKERYEAAAASIMRAKAQAEIVEAMARRRMQQIQNIAHGMELRLNKVMRVLVIIECYLGVHEEIFQLQEGVPADAAEPISIRQLVLNMDEEAAVVDIYDHKNGYKVSGLTWRDVEEFDKWILDNPAHLQQVLPEPKGLVAIRPSNQNDNYDNLDPLSAAREKEQDCMIYLLIRNGENLYRVWTNVRMGDLLFPKLADEADVSNTFRNAFRAERAEIQNSVWMRNALLIQGLIDRTQIFQPSSVERIELVKPDAFREGGPVRLIRDAEMVITDGHESFYDWRSRVNKLAVRGTRIYLVGIPYDRDNRSRIMGNANASMPGAGIYTLEDVRKGTYTDRMYIIKYLPHDEIWDPYNSWKHDGESLHFRQRRVSIEIYGDEFINYDEITVEDIDYFLNSRLERSHYKQLIPLLIGLREHRMEELRQESDFVKLLANKQEIPEEKLWELVAWWKNKVINHRPLSKDDALAWRMILAKATGKRIVKPKSSAVSLL